MSLSLLFLAVVAFANKNSVSSLLKKLEERDEIKRDYAGYSRNIEING